MIINARTPARAQVSGASYTDDFESYTPDANLAGQGNWIQGLNNLIVRDISDDNVVRPYASYAHCAAIYNNTFADNQYSEIVVYKTANEGGIGPAVRMSGSGAAFDGYALVRYGADIQLYRYDNGSATILATGAMALDDGDVLRLEISGTTLSCYKNDVLITAIDGDGVITDATYETGNAGLAGRTDFSTSMSAKSWEGGDL